MGNKMNAAFGGISAPLEGADRGSVAGFTRYFAARPHHFEEIFGEPYTPEAAETGYKKMKVRDNPRRGHAKQGRMA